MPPTLAVPLGIPREVGPYQIQRVIGSGGMATVYAALQKQPRRTVALKVMKAGMASPRSAMALRRFKREIEILGKLHHPYIAAVYDAGTFDDGTGGGPAPYFVMEFIPGATNILEYNARKNLDMRDRLKLFVKVCAAVEHGHGNKIIHRDLKPGNILIDQYGEPKIIDFGIAHAAELDISQQTMQTEAGNLVGTLQYMAPEQVDTRPQDLDGRCDVYALGVLLYKMTTGKAPYDLEALPVFEAVRVIREELPRRPSEINPEVKGDLETIILKAMEHERPRRYRNAGSLGRDVVRFLANKPINARRASLVYRATLFAKRNALILGVIGVILLVAGAATGYVLYERSRLREGQAQEQASISQRERDLQKQRADMEARSAAAATQAAVNAAAPRGEPFTLSQHTGRINQLAFVPSASAHPLLASASEDHTLLLWDLESREPARRVDPLNAPISLLAAAADGSVVAVAGRRDGDPIAIVRCVDSQVVHTLRDLGGQVRSVALGPNGEMIAWGSSNLTLTLRPVAGPRAGAGGAGGGGAGAREPRSIRSSSGAITAMVFTRNENMCAAGSEGGVIHILEPRGNAGPRRLTGLKSPIVALTFIEGASTLRIAAVAEDGSACTWAQDGASWVGTPWQATGRSVLAAAFSPNGAHLALVTSDGAQVWSLGAAGEQPKRVGSTIKSDETPTSVAIDDQAKWIALGMNNGDVRVMPAKP